MKKILISCLASIFLFTACNDKDSDCQTSVATISGTYKVTSIKYKQNSGSPEVEMINSLPACEQDDLYILNSNGNFVYQDAGTTCGGGYTGAWSLSGNTITIDGDVGTIASWDCNILSVRGTDVLVVGDQVTITYDKQ